MKKFFAALLFAFVCFISNAQTFKHINKVSLDNVKLEVYMSSANSVGGRHYSVNVINCSDKTVKYINLCQIAVNNFCEPASCSITDKWMLKMTITGPIVGNKKLLEKSKIPNKYIHSYRNTDLHYNYAATKSIITYCKIEFTDGSVATYINDEYINFRCDHMNKFLSNIDEDFFDGDYRTWLINNLFK